MSRTGPHGVISIALLAIARGGETTCEHRPELMAFLSLVMSSFSIVLGVVSKVVRVVQRMAHAAGDELRAENARLREQLLSQSQGSELQGSE